MSVFSVIRELVKLSFEEEQYDPLNPLRVQKLLYFAEAWSLEILDRSLFQEPIQAWKFGPVVPSVYHEYKPLERSTIPFEAVEMYADLDPKLAAVVRASWDYYRDFAVHALVDMTHREMPWLRARDSLPRDAKCDRPILREWIRETYHRRERPAPLAAFEQKAKAAEAAAAARPPRRRLSQEEVRGMQVISQPPASWHQEDF